MFEVIKRVISGEDVGDGMEDEARKEESGGNFQATGTISRTTAAHYSDSPALVENDHDMDLEEDVKLTHIADVGVGNFTPRSSLSDVSAECEDGSEHERCSELMKMMGDDDMTNERNTIPEQHAATFEQGGNFPRNDSKVSNDSSSGSMRGSSQNSSRDWGWFEDVHASEQQLTPYLKRKDTTDDKNNKKKGKKGKGLVPHANEGPSSSEGLTEIMHSRLDNGKLTYHVVLVALRCHWTCRVFVSVSFEHDVTSSFSSDGHSCGDVMSPLRL